MPRKKKQEIQVNSSESLASLMQETYNDACLQINDSQKAMNELAASSAPTDIDDLTKIAKEKAGLLKVKDSAIRVKLELAKLQSDIIKNHGDINTTIAQRTDGKASTDDFKMLREMLKNNKEENNDGDSENI